MSLITNAKLKNVLVEFTDKLYYNIDKEENNKSKYTLNKGDLSYVF